MNTAITDIDTTNEEKILKEYYNHCVEKVAENNFLVMYAKEKLRHSYQVIGAGNYILKHEKIFTQSKDNDFLRSAKLAYLFHDIGRFTEIEKHFANPEQKYDHSVLSYEILKTFLEYAKPEILLPIKHHGHMIDNLYKDEDYQAITDATLKERINQIAFLVRDADKIANFYLLKTAWAKQAPELSLFFYDLPIIRPKQKAFDQYLNHEMVDRGQETSKGETLLNYLSWIYDLNYQSSFEFCQRNGVFSIFYQIIDAYIPDDTDKIKVKKQFEKSIQTTNMKG